MEAGGLFLLAAALLAVAVLAAIAAAILGDLADAGDDVLPLLFAVAAFAGLAGWYRDRRAVSGRLVEVEAERQRLAKALERRDMDVRQREEEIHALENELASRGEEFERAREESERRDSERRAESEAQERKLQEAQAARARLERAHRAEREWIRELRGQIVQLHREYGALGHTGDVREMVLEVALKLVEAEKGLLLSREDRDGDGDFDLVCHQGFRSNPDHSAVAQEFAGRVLERHETVREDDSSTLREESRTAADEEIRNLIAIPIFIQDDFSGVLVCANRDGGFEELEDDVLLALGDHAGAVLENGRLHGELRATYVATVRMLAEAIEVKDPIVRLHSDEVANLVASVASKLEIEPRRREELTIASLLHDVGKIGISERILLKPGPLTEEERSAIEMHPRIGFRLVEQVPALHAIAPAVLHHHERFDGDGYPAGLSGEQIPLEARVICVADSFSAMTSERPYQAPLALEDACAELERCAGTQFDPQVVRLFVEEVRARPPADRKPDGLALALNDPEVRWQRTPGEPVLGFGLIGLTDNLTLLYGRRYMHEAVSAQAERSTAQRRPFAVVLIELTGLAELNRRHGYGAGDIAIQETARIVQRAASRSGATACRHGGARLGLVVPGADADAGAALAVALAPELEAHCAGVITGVACWQEGESGEDVVARARLALTVRELATPGPHT